MVLDTPDWSRFPQELPVTAFLIVLMVGLWLGYTFGFIPPFVSLPQSLAPSAWLAHFFHMSLTHLLSNLLMTLFMGILLEKPLGPWRYLTLVLLVWNLTVLGLFWLNPYPVLGFSGISMGLMVLSYFYWQSVSQTAQLVGGLIALNILFGFMPGVSWHGHVIGALSGALVYGLIRVSEIGSKR